MTDEVEKLRSKLKMMEISFEQINNSRNDLIKELSSAELTLEDLKKLINFKIKYWIKEMDRAEFSVRANHCDEFIHELRELQEKFSN